VDDQFTALCHNRSPVCMIVFDERPTSISSFRVGTYWTTRKPR
jgi:hypothetical protein